VLFDFDYLDIFLLENIKLLKPILNWLVINCLVLLSCYKILERHPGQNHSSIDFLTVLKVIFSKNWKASPVYSLAMSGSDCIIFLPKKLSIKPKINKAEPNLMILPFPTLNHIDSIFISAILPFTQ
jgi:hypothetical protein